MDKKAKKKQDVSGSGCRSCSSSSPAPANRWTTRTKSAAWRARSPRPRPSSTRSPRPDRFARPTAVRQCATERVVEHAQLGCARRRSSRRRPAYRRRPPSWSTRSSLSIVPLLLLSMYQVPSRKMAISSIPSPLKSPESGMSPCWPKRLLSGRRRCACRRRRRRAATCRRGTRRSCRCRRRSSRPPADDRPACRTGTRGRSGPCAACRRPCARSVRSPIGGLLARARNVLELVGVGVVRIGQSRLVRDRPRIAAPGGAIDADVGLAVAVPVAGHRPIALVAQLGPQVAGVPHAVAVEIDEPEAVLEDADFELAVAVEVAGNGDIPSSCRTSASARPAASPSPVRSVHSMSSICVVGPQDVLLGPIAEVSCTPSPPTMPRG